METKAKIATHPKFTEGLNVSAPDKQRGTGYSPNSGIKQRANRITAKTVVANDQGPSQEASIPSSSQMGSGR